MLIDIREKQEQGVFSRKAFKFLLDLLVDPGTVFKFLKFTGRNDFKVWSLSDHHYHSGFIEDFALFRQDSQTTAS